MVDPQPVDEAVAHELEHLRVRRLEHLLVLDAHAGELADVEEAAVEAGARVDVEELLRSSGSRQNGFSSLAAMWFGTTSSTTPRPAPRERAQLLLAAELVGDRGADRRRRSRASSPRRAWSDGDR